MSAKINPVALRRGMGVTRLGFGLALLVAPGPLGRMWWGSEASVPTKGSMRGLGARDAAIGAGTALFGGQAARGWLRAGVAADAGDVLAAALSGSAVPARNRAVVIVMAAGGVVAGLVLDRVAV